MFRVYLDWWVLLLFVAVAFAAGYFIGWCRSR